METMGCLPSDTPSHTLTNGHTVITADPDLTAAAANGHPDDDKDSGVLSEPEELRRISKRTRMRRSLNFNEKTEQTVADLPSDQMKSVISSAAADDRKKQRSVWTRPETKAFYDAVAEHGKDFQAIQIFIQNKVSPESSKKNKSISKSISIPVPGNTSSPSTVLVTLPQTPSAATVTTNWVKSREQVRHFYYRTWHKISSCCHFEDALKSSSPESGCDMSPEKIQETLRDIDKGVMELYGLINYGEIWKKFPTKWDSRIKSHLKELVLEGSTVIKIGPKSKAMKIKTPICKALKKLNGQGVDCDTSVGADSLIQQLPDEVIVQLIPEDNESFLKVQSIAQNPRMQCRIFPQKKISSLAVYLEHYKWDSDRYRRSLCSEATDCSIDESQLELRGCVKLSLHRSHHQALDSLGTGMAISQSSCGQSVDSCVTQVASLAHQCPNLGLSFRSYLRSTQRFSKSISKTVQKTRKDNKTLTSSISPTAGDETSPVRTATKSIPIEVEDSCSSTSSITPFRDTVKKLAILNQALNSEADDDSESKLKSPSKTKIESPEIQVLEERGVVSSSIRDEGEVSLPPPTATLAQWLSSRGNTDHEADHGNDEDTREKISDEDKILLDIESIRDGWTSADTSITFAELYLLLKSPAKIILTYSIFESEHRPFRDEQSERHFRIIQSNEDPKSKDNSLLDKLLTAASISLSLNKKSHAASATIACLPFVTTQTTITTATSASIQQPNCSTVPRVNVSTTNRSPTNIIKKQTQQMSSILPVLAPALPAAAAAALPGQSLVSDQMPILSSQHNFLIPTGPAPKAAIHPTASSSNAVNPCQSGHSATSDNNHPGIINNISSNSSSGQSGCSSSNNNNSNKRSRIICEDPQVLEDAIKQLNQNRFMPKKKRQRVIRPITVGPVSSKLLLPRQTLQMIPAAATPAPHIQILSAPAAVAVPASDTGTATTGNTLSLPICFTPNAVPTILIPTAMITTANLNAQTAPAPAAAAASGLESESSPSVTLTPVTQALVNNTMPVSVGHSEPVSLDPRQRIDGPDDDKTAPAADSLCGSGSSDLHLPGLGQNSNSLPCLSSLLELSLPDAATPVTSTASIGHSFFNDNSCSSISEFISFGNPNMAQAALPVAHSSCGSSGGGKDAPKSGQTPNWLLNEGSNSSSLGLSSLIFNGNELI